MTSKSPDTKKGRLRQFFSGHSSNRQPSKPRDETPLSVPTSPAQSMDGKSSSSFSWKERLNPFHRASSPAPTTRPTTPIQQSSLAVQGQPEPSAHIDTPAETQPEARPPMNFPAQDVGKSKPVSNPNQGQLQPNESPPPPSSKSAARAAFNFTKTLLKRVAEVAETDPVKLAFGLVKVVMEIADAVKDNMDTTERRICSISLQIEAVEQALGKWKDDGGAERRGVERFKTALGDEFGKLKQLSNEKLWKRTADYEGEKADIAEIFERVNDAVLQLGVEANLRTLRMARTMDKHVKESLLRELQPSKRANHTYGLVGSEKDKLRRSVCTPGTRVAVREAIIDWAKRGSEPVYWLSGPAGSGKSTIAYTLARRFELAPADDPVVLGASFLCSRHYEETRSPKYIIPTIAHQLALRFKPFADALIETDKLSSAEKDIEDQPDDLLIAPWQQVLKSQLSTNKGPNRLIIVDALDELDSGGSDFLQILLSALADNSLPGLKFLVTSRPNPELVQRLTKFDGTKSFRLQDIAPEDARADVEVYLRDALPGIANSPQFLQLVILTDGLFVYAATIVKHLLPRILVEQLRFLESLLALRTAKGLRTGAPLPRQATRLLDELYYQLLVEAFQNFEQDSDEYLDRLSSLHTFLCANEPISTSTAASLLFEAEYTNTDPGSSLTPIVDSIVDGLHAVLYVENGKVLSYHKSFTDFIFDEARSNQFRCNPSVRHCHLAEASFRIMTAGLHFNIANIPSSYVLDSQNQDLPNQIERNILPPLRYACHHWAHHLSSLPPPPSPSPSPPLPSPPNPDSLCDALQNFLSLPALFWIEAMNLLGSHDVCDSMFQSAYHFLSQYELPWAEQYLEASNFAVYFTGSPASLSTPHLYLSSLATWPRNTSPVAEWKSHFPGIPLFTNPHREGTCLSTFNLNSPVRSATFSPDGSKIISGTKDALVRIMDSSTGKVLRTLEGHKDRVCAIACSNDGTRIASGSKDNTIRIWDAETGQLLTTLAEHDDTVMSIAFSPNSTRLVSGSHDEQALVWDLDTGNVEHILDEHCNSVMAVAYSPNSRYIVTGSLDRDVILWNPEDGKVLQMLKGHEDKVWAAAISWDSTRVASGDDKGKIKIWDPSSGECLFNLSCQAHVTSIAFLPNKEHIVISTDASSIGLWDTCTGKVLRTFEGHLTPVYSVCISPKNGRRMVSGSDDGTIRVWDTSMSGRVLEMAGHTGRIRKIVISQDGKQITSASDDGTIHIRDSTTGSLLKTMEVQGECYWSIAMTKDGSRIVTGSGGGLVCIWDAVEGGIIGELKGHKGGVYAIAVSQDGKRIFSGSEDKSVKVWDAQSRELLKEFNGHSGEVLSLCVWPNGTRIVSASTDLTLKIWDALADDTSILTLRGHTAMVCGVALSGDGSRIVSASRDKTLRLWDGDSGDLLRVIEGHADEVNRVDISDDGARIVSGSCDGTIGVWNADTGEMLSMIEGHTSAVLSVKFFNNATRVVSGGIDKTLRIWDLSPTTTPLPYILETLENSIPTGWLLSPGGEGHLMFIPHAVRLPHSSNILTIPSSAVSSVDLSNTCLGRQWTSCYLPKSS